MTPTQPSADPSADPRSDPGSILIEPTTDQVPSGASVPQLREAAADCHGCELWEPATQTVFSAGNDHAPIMLVGEQPGDQEDQQGIPFVGPAGKLLQRALEEAEIPRTDVYVTNAVKHFRFEPRGKRRLHQTPMARHVNACRPWLDAELRAVRPRLVISLGATAGKALLGPSFRIGTSRGRVIETQLADEPARVFATIHPSAILRMDDAERDDAYAAFVADLRAAAAAA